MLLKKHPNAILGKRVETNFLVWMRIGAVLDSPNLTIVEKIDAILEPLFGKCPYGAEEAALWFGAVVEFYSRELEDRGISPPREQLVDWEVDSDTIWADFLLWYRIDLDNKKMHWWKFRAMFDSLPSDSAIKTKMAIRGESLSDYIGKGQERLYQQKEEQKRMVAVRAPSD